MARKGLVVYVSRTGNTEKVALRFKKVFLEHGWECDCIKITKNMKPVNLDEYALICAGSLIMGGSPARELHSFWMGGSAFPDVELDGIPEGGPPPGGLPPGGGMPPGGMPPGGLGPGSLRRRDPAKYKKGIAFVTYGGTFRGPVEALPALALMELQMEEQGYRCIGKFACPGKDITPLNQPLSGPENAAESRNWHWDQQKRPHERDLQKAEIFLAEIIEDYFQPNELPAEPQYLCIA